MRKLQNAHIRSLSVGRIFYSTLCSTDRLALRAGLGSADGGYLDADIGADHDDRCRYATNPGQYRTAVDVARTCHEPVSSGCGCINTFYLPDRRHCRSDGRLS